MSRVFAFSLLFGSALLAVATPGFASGYTSLNLGIAAKDEGRVDAAVQSLSTAIASPDLPDELRPVAYVDRASAYAASGRFTDAIADCDASLKLRPDWYDSLSVCGFIRLHMHDDAGAEAAFTAAVAAMPDRPEGYFGRAEAYADQGNLDAAIADDNKVISLAPEAPQGLGARAAHYELEGHYDLAMQDRKAAVDLSDGDYGLVHMLGIAQWAAGRYQEATSSFRHALRGEQQDPLYDALWLDISEAAQDPNTKPEPEATPPDKPMAWPAPLLSFFSGNLTADAVFAAISTSDATLKNQQTCEANFYIGEWRLLHKSADPAQPLIEDAARSCPKDFIEYIAANVELQRMRAAK